MLKIVDMELEDAHRIQPRPEDDFQLDVIPTVLEQRGEAYSIWHEDRLLACCGFVILWDGVAEAWNYADQIVAEYPREITHSLGILIEQVIMNYNLHRMQTHVRVSWTSANKFMKRCGFVHEGTLKQYGKNGEDYNLYARVIPWQ